MEGWRDGEVEGWKGFGDGNNGMEDVRMGRMEGWRDGETKPRRNEG